MMLREWTMCRWGVCALFVAGVLGCGNTLPPPVLPDTPDPGAAAKAIELFDMNKDGFLDAKELEKSPGLKAALKQVDANNDGKLSADEISARLQQWADSKAGRVSATCKVLRMGKPLVDAKVTYRPEPFLGGTLQPGTGTTNHLGYAEISCPYSADSSVRGVSPGFYRVEITKDGENIPPKYNTETVLGVEVAHGSESEMTFPVFNVQN